MSSHLPTKWTGNSHSLATSLPLTFQVLPSMSSCLNGPAGLRVFAGAGSSAWNTFPIGCSLPLTSVLSILAGSLNPTSLRSLSWAHGISTTLGPGLYALAHLPPCGYLYAYHLHWGCEQGFSLYPRAWHAPCRGGCEELTWICWRRTSLQRKHSRLFLVSRRTRKT